MATYTVATQSRLDAVLRDASSGDTIRLESGSYNLKMLASRQQDFDFNDDVTITSANKSKPAEIKQMLLRDVSHVTLTDVVLDYERAGSVTGSLSRTKKFFVERSDNVTFDRVSFDGEVANGYGTGLGLRVKGSSDIAILDSEFVNLENGLNFLSVDDVRIVGNTTRRISNDAMYFEGIDGMTIEDNDFVDFHSDPRRKHKDAIQFSTTGSTPSTDIVINNNRVDNPEQTHGFFFGNSSYRSGSKDAFYKNITITNNDIHAASKLAIAIQHVDGATIRGNVLTQNKDEGLNKNVNIPLINVTTDSRNVTIVGNRVEGVQKAEDKTWTVSGNITGNTKVTFWTGGDDDAASNRAVAATAFAPAAAAQPSVAREVRASAHDASMTTKAGYAVTTLDFDAGDEFVFTGFHEQTFRDVPGGNSVYEFLDGSAVRIDSAVDLRELVEHSPALSAQVNEKTDALILLIDQGDDGVARVKFEGLGHDYLAVDPGLF